MFHLRTKTVKLLMNTFIRQMAEGQLQTTEIKKDLFLFSYLFA